MTGTVHLADRPRTRLRRRGLLLCHPRHGDAGWTTAAAAAGAVMDAVVTRCLEQASTASGPLDSGGQYGWQTV